jgi:hypothetical protein
MTDNRRKVTLPSLGYVSINFYCSAFSVSELYEKLGEFDRQKKINHLGLISNEIDGATHTRYEYLMLQCALADILDKLNKGVYAQGELKVSGKAFKGNGLLKSWFLLSNFGHLKNTFGDEKTLIIYALKRKGFKSKLLNIIKSIELRAWCECIITNFQYHKFHYVLAIYRIYKEQPRQLEKQKEMIVLMELLLLDIDNIPYKVNKSKLLQLRSLFKKIRDITIVTIDGHYSHTPLSIDLISSLVSFDEIEGGVFGKDISSSFSPLRKSLHEEIYLNPEVLARQRSYELDSLKNLNELVFTKDTYDEIINMAINSGITIDHKKDLNHFCRIPIHPDIQPATSFYDEFRNVTLRVKKNCPNVEAYLDVNPYSKTRYADFFISDRFVDSNLPKYLTNISTLIKDQISYLYENIKENHLGFLVDFQRLALAKGVDDLKVKEIYDELYLINQQKISKSANKYLVPLYRNLLWSVIKFFIKDNYRIEIDPSDDLYDNYSFSFPGFNDEYITKSLSDAISHEIKIDKDRAHELEMLMHLAKRNYNGYKIVCMARINILDMTQSPDKMKATDIDGLLLKISDTSISLDFLEAKNNKRGREKVAIKDIRKLLVPILNKKGRYSVTKVKNYGAKLHLKCEAKILK